MENHKIPEQRGFSLIEIMIGLVIGLLATLVILNVISVFDHQKRATMGSSDAQTNGAIALFNLQRDIQPAGYSLPVFGASFSPFNCPVDTALDLNANTMTPTLDHDNDASTPRIGLSPIIITDGNGANGSDTISIRNGDSMKAGISVNMEAGTAANVVQVDTSMGCNVNDVALVIRQPLPGGPLMCSMTRVLARTAVGVTPATVTLNSTTNVAVGNTLSCLGIWNEIQYAVNARNQLTRSGAITAGVPSAAPVAIVPDIVNMQAQYGISATPNSNQVIQWVDATGPWAEPGIGVATPATPCSAVVADRNCIKSVHIAVVARNNLLETTNVTTACSSLSAANPTGLCAWAGVQATGPVVASPAPAVTLLNADFERYRYRVYDTIIPVKNIILSRSAL